MRRAILLGLAALVVAGCSDDPGGTAAPGRVAATVTTPSGGPPTASPARPTRPPAEVEAPCPYADAETIAGTVGQRIYRITVTRTTPYPGCGFYRGNDEKAVDIAVSALPEATTARARAVALPGRSADPVDGVGDGGAVAVTDAGCVLAVSTGRALVVVRVNQHVPLEAVEIAKLVVGEL